MPRGEGAVAKTRKNKNKALPDPEGENETVEKPVGPKRQTAEQQRAQLMQPPMLT
jgi:hypothetical protein